MTRFQETSAQRSHTKSAFPHGGAHNIQPGLTKREYFAAMLMQGLYANNGLPVPSPIDPTDDEGRRARERRAEAAVRGADSLIAALSDEKKDVAP